MTNIRWVMQETAQLSERVDALTKAIEKLPGTFEKATDRLSAEAKERTSDLRADHRERINELKGVQKETLDRVIGIEGRVAFVRGAAWVFGGLFVLLVAAFTVIAKFALDKM